MSLTSVIFISLASFLTAGLTLFSGFGLGTLLMPVFALFFPVETAVAATALVHGANNLFKIPLFARRADREIVKKFGLPAIAAAFLGAWLLERISDLPPLHAYFAGSRLALITPVKLVMALLIFVFSMWELVPAFGKIRFDRRWLPLGGLLSGFFGGLSGHQGALRSAFLVNAGLTTERFVGTTAVIAFLVDLSRLAVYAAGFRRADGGFGDDGAWTAAAAASGAAFLGVLAGKRFLAKVTMRGVQRLTGVLLLAISLALALGLI